MRERFAAGRRRERCAMKDKRQNPPLHFVFGDSLIAAGASWPEFVTERKL